MYTIIYTATQKLSLLKEIVMDKKYVESKAMIIKKQVKLG